MMATVDVNECPMGEELQKEADDSEGVVSPLEKTMTEEEGHLISLSLGSDRRIAISSGIPGRYSVQQSYLAKAEERC